MSGGIGQVQYDLTGTDFDAAYTQFKDEYRVVDIHGYLDGGSTKFSVIYERDKSGIGKTVDVNHSKADVDRDRVAYAAAGMRPVLFNGYRSSAGRSFTWVWEQIPGSKRSVHRDLAIEELHPHADRARAAGKRIVDLSVYENPVPTSVIQFATIWDEDDGSIEWAVTGPSDSNHTQVESDSMAGAGWRLVRTSGWSTSAGNQYVRLWDLTPTTFQSRRALTSADLGTALDARDADGLRPEQLDSFSRNTPAVARHCPVWRRRDAATLVPALVADFAHAYELPAVSLAVARRGRLVYSYGYGDVVEPDTVTTGGSVTVDTGGEVVVIPEPILVPGNPVRPDRTLFRIASLTKPITSAAIMRLVEAGTLRLSDKVLAPGGPLAHFAPSPADPRISDITVLNLLQHGAGGWSADAATDPMFTATGLSTDDLVRKVLAERRLDNAPGTNYAYSNFGYCLLGRLIEAVAGQTYEKHLQDGLLAQCGITGMSIASDGQPTGDVIRCYRAADDTIDPYQHRIDRMDSHGGWQATAVDLVRFAVRVDGRGTDVLSAASIATMTTPSQLPGSDGYAAGWGVNPNTNPDPGTWNHIGVLPGATAVLQRTDDDQCLVVLTNYNERHDPASNTVDGLYRLLTRIRGQVDYWPLDDDL